MDSKVAIIGNDHINTLGVIRAFGENNIKPYVFLISDKKNNAVVKSKYVEKYWIFNNEEKALQQIIEYFKKEKSKVALIPTSDKSTLYLDKNYTKLKDKFYTPNINNKNGCIYKYMNKFKQQELLEKNKVKGIKSQIIKLDKISDKLKIEFPIILKPNISAEGNKNDIKICKNNKEFEMAKKQLINDSYSEILVQNFINYDYECDIQGFSINGVVAIPGIIEKIRIYPPKRGSTTYGKVVSNKKYNGIINEIQNIMKELKYTGIFDIDFFYCKGQIYLNEINFRNSAVSYAYGKSYIPYYWYLSCVNDKLILPPYINEEYTFLDDQADLHNIISKIIPVKEYIRSKRNSKILLVKNKKDSKPSKYMAIYKCINKIF